MVIWLIGLPGSGKTSIGRSLWDLLRQRNRATVLLDGDDVRKIIDDDLGYTVEDRRLNGWRICRLCKYLDAQGIDVVCSILSLFHDQQRWNRANYSGYFEVLLDVSMKVLMERDQKGLYSRAMSGQVANVAGVDIPFEPPRNPDLVVANDAPMQDFTSIAKRIRTALASRGKKYVE